MPQETVLVTGATGFIAKHVVAALLNSGYSVVGSSRSLRRESEMRDALTPALDDEAALERFRLVELDLGSDQGWTAAMDGVDVLVHTASPFPLVQPDDPDVVIRPAVEGARRALRTAEAAGVSRIVLTSSAAAILDAKLPAGRTAYDESDWTNGDDARLTPYVRSKTLAERAAWEFAESHPDLRLTVINPTLVLGPPLDTNFGTSIELVERLMKGRDPMLPNFGLPVVDVRDVALMHLRAVERPETAGKRYIGAASFLWYPEMAEILAEEFPRRKITTRRAPNFAIRLFSFFDKSVRVILPDLDKRKDVSNDRATEELAVDFRPAADAVRAAGHFLADSGRV